MVVARVDSGTDELWSVPSTVSRPTWESDLGAGPLALYGVSSLSVDGETLRDLGWDDPADVVCVRGRRRFIPWSFSSVRLSRGQTTGSGTAGLTTGSQSERPYRRRTGYPGAEGPGATHESTVRTAPRINPGWAYTLRVPRRRGQGLGAGVLVSPYRDLCLVSVGTGVPPHVSGLSRSLRSLSPTPVVPSRPPRRSCPSVLPRTLL